MEQEMMEDGNDNVMDEEMEYSFMDNEIDLDYEFDAARFYDFSLPESLAETRHAELWFHSAGSYPPSRMISFQISFVFCFIIYIFVSNGLISCVASCF